MRGKSASKADQNTVLPCVDTKEDEELLYETVDRNLYMNIFLKDLCLRPSCYSCPAKSGKCGSDITLADYWGIWNHYPEMDDDKGTSLVLVNTPKGMDYYNRLTLRSLETPYEVALAGNPALERSASESRYVSEFWRLFGESKFKDVPSMLKRFRPSFMQRVKRRAVSLLKNILPKSLVSSLKSKIKR